VTVDPPTLISSRVVGLPAPNVTPGCSRYVTVTICAVRPRTAQPAVASTGGIVGIDASCADRNLAVQPVVTVNDPDTDGADADLTLVAFPVSSVTGPATTDTTCVVRDLAAAPVVRIMLVNTSIGCAVRDREAEPDVTVNPPRTLVAVCAVRDLAAVAVVTVNDD